MYLSLQQQNLIKIEDDILMPATNIKLSDYSLPATLDKVVMSRVDILDVDVQLVLKTAAVIGMGLFVLTNIRINAATRRA